MPAPVPARRERLVGMLLFGIAVVLVISSPTWFAGGRALVGAAQLSFAAVIAGIGVWLYRRAG